MSASTDSPLVLIADESALDPDALREQQEQAKATADAQEQAMVKHWFKRIEASRKLDEDERKEWKRWRSFMDAKPEDEDGEAREFLVDAPLLQGVIETTQAAIYAKDPEVSVQPEDSVDAARMEAVRNFSKTLEIILSRLFRDGDLKSAIKRQSLSAMTNCVGWVKVLLQQDKRTDPLIVNKISDMRDNLRRIDSLLAHLKDPAACADVDQLKAELTDQLRALEDRVEVAGAMGAAFDFIHPDDLFVDENLREVADYRQAGWLAQREFMTTAKARETFGLGEDGLRGAKTYADQAGEDRTTTQEGTEPKGFVAVYEVWDRNASTIYTMIDGCKTYARPPYSPTPASRRFYPFFLLGFHFIDKRRWPRSDVDLAHKLQEEASRALSNFAEHRRRVRPKTFFNKQNLKPEDVSAIQGAENIELVGLDPVDPAIPLSNLLHTPSYPQVDPGLYDIGVYRAAIEEIFGLQDAARGAVVKAKTATEAGFQEAGKESRMDWRRDAIEEQLTEISRYLAELVLQAFPVEVATRYAGPGAMWPTLDKEEIYALVSINIRGGSSGKPDTRAEREAWATLLPMIEKAIAEISMLQGNPQTQPAAEAKIELLKETVRRMDDRIDVERFIPKVAPMLSVTPGVTAGAPNLTAVPPAAVAA